MELCGFVVKILAGIIIISSYYGNKRRTIEREIKHNSKFSI